MIRDLEQATPGEFEQLDYDVCICGAGPAGITLALELAPQYRVLLLEAGGTELTGRSQQLYQGDIVGHPYFPLDVTRLRYLGGTSNHWAGWCKPLDAHDFETRDAVPHSGWPIGVGALTPYLARACDYVELAGSDWAPGALAHWEKPLVSTGDLRRAAFRWSPPTNFGTRYRPALEDTDGLDCWLNANLVAVSLSGDGRRVARVEFRNYAGRSFHARPRFLVLATGGIENPRLLLNLGGEGSNGLGNRHDLVGRYFGDHPHYIGADFLLEDGPRAAVAREIGADWGLMKLKRFRFYTPTPAFQRKAGLANYCIRLQPRNVVSSALQRTFKERLRAALCESELARDMLDEVRAQGLLCPDSVDGTLMVTWEQYPNPDSRVRLGSERDQFGLRRAQLDWQLQPADKEMLRRAVTDFGRRMAADRIGRVRVRDWVMDSDASLPGYRDHAMGGNHHIGTTRMARRPEEGVVDPDSRVFGTDNLYIAGSSVFPTMGYANPTLTIVQMTLRLADHLDRVLRRS